MASKSGKTPVKTVVAVEDSPARYNTAVRQGRAAIASQYKFNWVLGDLALKVATTYGASTIERFAADLDVPGKSLYDFRKVAEQYPADQRGVASWTVHQILGREDDRFELVQEAMTTAAARAIVQSRKPAGDGDGEGEGDSADDADGAGEDDLPTQLAKAEANRDRLAGELQAAEAKIAKIKAEMDKQIRAAVKRPRRQRASRDGALGELAAVS
jgi:hypothetical protein